MQNKKKGKGMARTISETDYERKIETFTYLTKAAITIPELVRARAFELAIDVRIIRTEVPQYANFRPTPDSGFYGYINLILDDFSLEAMKISQPRQRVWKQIRPEAYSAWTDWMYAESLRVIIKKNKDAICALSAGLMIVDLACAPEPCTSTSEPIFREVDLREIYIECDRGTRFQVEISWVQMLPILNSCGEMVTPSSGQSDDKKDRGLPPEGVQPSNGNSPNSPASAGLPPISSPSDLRSFANDKHGVDAIPLDNIPTGDDPATPEREGWYFSAIWATSRTSSTCDIHTASLYRGCTRGVNFSSERLYDMPFPCPGHAAGSFSVTDPVSGYSFSRGYVSPNAEISLSRGYGILPQGTL